jgi:hypothetical protein
MKALCVTTLLFALAASAPSLAQGDTASPQPQDCQARPEKAPGAKGPGDTANQAKQEDGDSNSMTAKLERCSGVLRPPRVGDTEMATPAPDQGKTPIIRPNEIEPQTAVPQ